MDEIWERAVETALDGQSDPLAVRTLTLDGAVKCVQGRLPQPDLLERFRNLEHLSMANIGASSLEQFPRLGNLQKLILSDNRIAGGLEFLVQAGLDSLRDLDLSNNRIQFVEDLVPLAQLKLVSLDLYECPVTRLKDYRSRVFGLIKSLRYLDKMDAEENEIPESDEEEDEDEDEEDEDDEDDPGSCEVDGEDRPNRMSNGHSERMEGVVEVDEEEEGEADEEETETGRQANGVSHQANGFMVEHLNVDDEEDDDDGDDDDGFGEEEIDEEDGEDNDDVVEVHEIEDSDDGDDDDDDDDEGIEDDEEDEDEEEVDNDEGDFRVPESNGFLTSTDGEIDGHEQGEDDDGDGDGETEEEQQGVEDADEEEEGYEGGYLVLPAVAETLEEDDGEDDEEIEDDNVEDEEEEDDDDAVQVICPPSSSHLKRKRDDDDNSSGGDDDDDNDNDDGSNGDDDDDGGEDDDRSKRNH